MIFEFWDIETGKIDYVEITLLLKGHLWDRDRSLWIKESFGRMECFKVLIGLNILAIFYYCDKIILKKDFPFTCKWLSRKQLSKKVLVEKLKR
jgi:hypothetical protein